MQLVNLHFLNCLYNAETMDVMAALTGFNSWEILAFYLGVPEKNVRDIRRLRSTEPLLEVIKYWLGTPHPTWEQLALALEQCGAYQIAYNIKRKYVKVKLVILYVPWHNDIHTL